MPELTYPKRLRGLSNPLARGVPCISGKWNVLSESRVTGQGDGDFAIARNRIMSWEMHRSTGLRVETDGDVSPARTVTLSLGVGPLLIAAHREVVWVVDEPQEAGFVYGTLAGHPERGEEALLVRLLDIGTLVGSVAAFFRPAPWGAALGSPVM